MGLLDVGRRVAGRLVRRARRAVAEPVVDPLPTPAEREELLQVIRGEETAALDRATPEPAPVAEAPPALLVEEEIALCGVVAREGITVAGIPVTPTCQNPAAECAGKHAWAEGPVQITWMDDETPPAGHKRCNGCGEIKPLDAYFKMARYPDGRRPKCKVCMGHSPRPRRARSPKPTEPSLPPPVFAPLDPADLLGPCLACGLSHAVHPEDGACPPIPDDHARCSQCKVTQPRSDFPSDRSKASGHRSSCRQCERVREYVRRHGEAPSEAWLDGEAALCRGCGTLTPTDVLTDGLCQAEDCRAELTRRRARRRTQRAAQKARARARRRAEAEARAVEVLEAGHKICERCETDKPLDAFPRRPSAPDGRSGVCSVCVQVARGAEDPGDVERRRRWAAQEQQTLDLVPAARAAQEARRAELVPPEEVS